MEVPSQACVLWEQNGDRMEYEVWLSQANTVLCGMWRQQVENLGPRSHCPQDEGKVSFAVTVVPPGSTA